MAFDERWEKEIYLRNKQVNSYPYDFVVSSTFRLLGREKEREKLQVLELGCGTGNNLKFFSEFGFGRIVGIDGSQSALTLAKEKLADVETNLDLIVTDFRKIPEPDNTFSLVLDRGSVTHNDFQSTLEIVSEIKRVLKSGGYFMSYLFSSQSSAAFLGKKIGRSFYQAFGVETGTDAGLNTSFYNMADILDMFDGFDIISCVHEITNEMIKEPSTVAAWKVIARKS